MFATRSPHRRPTLVLAVGLCATLAACGGGEDPNPSGAASAPAATATATPEPPTRAEYVETLDALCVGMGKRKAGKSTDRAVAAAGRDLNAALTSGARTESILDRTGRAYARLADLRDAAAARYDAVPEPADPLKWHRGIRRTTERTRDFAAIAAKASGPYQRWLPKFNRAATAMVRSAKRDRRTARAEGFKQCGA